MGDDGGLDKGVSDRSERNCRKPSQSYVLLHWREGMRKRGAKDKFTFRLLFYGATGRQRYGVLRWENWEEGSGALTMFYIQGVR